MNIFHLILLAIIQGACELLPVSSSAHVIVAEKLLGYDPSSPELTYILVMLHTGTMVAVIFYFWKQWKTLLNDKKALIHFAKMIILATFYTGVIGFGLKLFIEKIVFFGTEHSEVEHLFKNFPLMSLALFSVGLLIIYAGWNTKKSESDDLTKKQASIIGVVQGLCLPFRGFSRSGATISAALLQGVKRESAEVFSFALAVVLTPPVIFLEVRRLIKAHESGLLTNDTLSSMFLSGLLGMVFSCLAGFLALRLLSSWLEKGRWQFFGYYCLFASISIFTLYTFGYLS